MSEYSVPAGAASPGIPAPSDVPATTVDGPDVLNDNADAGSGIPHRFRYLPEPVRPEDLVASHDVSPDGASAAAWATGFGLGAVGGYAGGGVADADGD